MMRRQTKPLALLRHSSAETPEFGRFVTTATGNCPALNTGFRHSRGQLLTWTSDDNLFLPNTLDKLVRYLEDRPHVHLVYAGCIGIDENGDRLEEGRILTAALPKILPLRNCIGACFLYRRHVYEKLGDYDPESFLVEDYEYWIRASINFTIHYLDELTLFI